MRDRVGCMLCLCLALILCALWPAPQALAAAQTPVRLQLPQPDTTGGKPLMQALAARKSDREFSTRSIDDHVLSELLWATWGVNRPDGRRTAPTARNAQNVMLYVVRADGVWRFDGPTQSLELVLDMDARSKFDGTPITLLYAGPDNDDNACMHIGSLYQNAYLYCASSGLATVVKRSGVDTVSNRLNMPEGYKVMAVQAVGWPR